MTTETRRSVRYAARTTTTAPLARREGRPMVYRPAIIDAEPESAQRGGRNTLVLLVVAVLVAIGIGLPVLFPAPAPVVVPQPRPQPDRPAVVEVEALPVLPQTEWRPTTQPAPEAKPYPTPEVLFVPKPIQQPISVNPPAVQVQPQEPQAAQPEAPAVVAPETPQDAPQAPVLPCQGCHEAPGWVSMPTALPAPAPITPAGSGAHHQQTKPAPACALCHN